MIVLSSRGRQNFLNADEVKGAARPRPHATRSAHARLVMSDSTESNDERPCLHCLIADVIDDFYAEYGSLSGEKDAVDVDEIITALAKTVAEMTYGSNAALRQRILEDLM